MKVTDEELEMTRKIVKPVVLVIRRELLRVIQREKSRHWKMRGQHRLGRHFERGFYRGLNHASSIVKAVLKPERFKAQAK